MTDKGTNICSASFLWDEPAGGPILVASWKTRLIISLDPGSHLLQNVPAGSAHLVIRSSTRFFWNFCENSHREKLLKQASLLGNKDNMTIMAIFEYFLIS